MKITHFLESLAQFQQPHPGLITARPVESRNRNHIMPQSKETADKQSY